MRTRSHVAERLPGFALLLAISALFLPSCDSDGQFTVLGYTTRPQYNMSIHTVYVPIFKNRTLYRGMEYDLTRAVVREIEAKTPYKVASCRDGADTELTGTIINFNKNILNRNQLNEIREAETVLGAEVVWKNLRTGEILSQPRPAGAVAPAAPALPVPDNMPGQPVAIPNAATATRPAVPAPAEIPAPNVAVVPVLVQSTAGFIPELGQSLTSAQIDNVNRLAIQIVSMMEKPW